MVLIPFGKTTLTDIFQSLKENDPQKILVRKTIPNQEHKNQSIILSVKENESDKREQ